MGTVLPARTSDVGSAVDGRLVELPVVEGQHVAADEPIAELLRGLLEIERAGAAAELDRRRANARPNCRPVSRPEEIEQARALVARDSRPGSTYARSRLARLSRLSRTGHEHRRRGSGRPDRVARRSKPSSAAAALPSPSTEAGPRQEQVAQAAAAVAVQEAEVGGSTTSSRKHTIRAPFDGWVVQRFTEKGQWVARGGLVARIAELDTVEIEVRVPESSIGTLREGADVRLEFDAAPDHAWIGSIARIVPQADLLSRSFPVKIRLENRIVDGQPVIKGGMLARAWLPVGTAGRGHRSCPRTPSYSAGSTAARLLHRSGGATRPAPCDPWRSCWEPRSRGTSWCRADSSREGSWSCAATNGCGRA